MNIWLIRHGQTDLNKKSLNQGIVDEPLNDYGIEQAEKTRAMIEKSGIVFDRVYASQLNRAFETARIVSGFDSEDIIIDKRIIEENLGRYEKKEWYMSMPLNFYRSCPFPVPAPKTVESHPHMVERAESILNDIKALDCENILIGCHGAILRALRGVMDDIPGKYYIFSYSKNCMLYLYLYSYDKASDKFSFRLSTSYRDGKPIEWR